VNKCYKFGDFTILIFCVCAYIVTKPYVGTFGLATIYAHTRKERSHSNQMCSICSRCLWQYVYKIL